MKGRLKKETVVSDLHPQIFPLSYLFYSVLRGFLQAVCCSLKKQPLQRLKAVCILPPASILFAEPSCWQHVDSRSEHAPWHADKPGGFEDEGSGPAWGARRLTWGQVNMPVFRTTQQKVSTTLLSSSPSSTSNLHDMTSICHRFLSPRRETLVQPAVLLEGPFFNV